MSRFIDAKRPVNIEPTLWGMIYVSILIGSIIGKELSDAHIIIFY